MNNDLADQYSIRKWLKSVGFDRKRIKTILLCALLGGLVSVLIDWGFDQYLEQTESVSTAHQQNLLLGFVEGAFIAALVLTITVLKKRS